MLAEFSMLNAQHSKSTGDDRANLHLPLSRAVSQTDSRATTGSRQQAAGIRHQCCYKLVGKGVFDAFAAHLSMTSNQQNGWHPVA